MFMETMFMERGGLERAGEARLKKAQCEWALPQAIHTKATGNVVLSNHHPWQKAVWKSRGTCRG